MAVSHREKGTKRAKPRLALSADKELKRSFEVLNHPWRVRILEVLSERDMGCAQMVDEGLIPELSELDRSEAISKLAYHFRILREVGALEVVQRNEKRGSTEQVCRGLARAEFTTEEWAELPRSERRAISRTVFQGLVARGEGALLYDTFDDRIDRHMVWSPMELDEQGWSEISQLLDGMMEAVAQLNGEAQARLKRTGEKPIRSTWGQLHFPSRPLPDPPADG